MWVGGGGRRAKSSLGTLHPEQMWRHTETPNKTRASSVLSCVYRHVPCLVLVLSCPVESTRQVPGMRWRRTDCTRNRNFENKQVVDVEPSDEETGAKHVASTGERVSLVAHMVPRRGLCHEHGAEQMTKDLKKVGHHEVIWKCEREPALKRVHDLGEFARWRQPIDPSC